ncbi:MAG: phage head morphogenesis protein [Desulfovibrio sp.]|jgi:SPP1 gp7 family putative phage head morphogenesis protein|nr:phage head morphogenesis protein [Desulfovibrio sp.]
MEYSNSPISSRTAVAGSKQAAAETGHIPPGPWPNLRWSFADAARAGAGASDFRPNKAAESRYERQLVNIAGQVERITRNGGSPEEIERKLREYAEVIEPWARQSASNMTAGVNFKNVKAWRGMSGKMGRDMRGMIEGPGIGAVIRDAIDKNVKEIKSLALGSADKVAEIVREGLITGSRSEDLAKRIAKAGEVSISKARTIARTEVGKAQSSLTKERATSVGSTGYIWRTAGDGDVRDSHRNMEGKFVAWDKPPTLDGMTGHAGEFPNDRCYAEPVVPKENAGGSPAETYKQPLQTRAEAEASGQKTLYSAWERQETSRVIPHAPESPLVGVDNAMADKHGKLVKYSLNPNHPSGRHKARVWKATLGATQGDADMIYDQVMSFLPYAEAAAKEADKHGERFSVVVPVTGPNGKTVDVKTAWIYDRAKDGRSISMKPRLATIYVPEDNHAR